MYLSLCYDANDRIFVEMKSCYDYKLPYNKEGWTCEHFSVQVIKKYIIEYLRSTQEHTDQGEIGQSVCKCTVVAHNNNVVQYIYYVLIL